MSPQRQNADFVSLLEAKYEGKEVNPEEACKALRDIFMRGQTSWTDGLHDELLPFMAYAKMSPELYASVLEAVLRDGLKAQEMAIFLRVEEYLQFGLRLATEMQSRFGDEASNAVQSLPRFQEVRSKVKDTQDKALKDATRMSEKSESRRRWAEAAVKCEALLHFLDERPGSFEELVPPPAFNI